MLWIQGVNTCRKIGDLLEQISLQNNYVKSEFCHIKFNLQFNRLTDQMMF